jgi:hypothetical protein
MADELKGISKEAVVIWSGYVPEFAGRDLGKRWKSSVMIA